MKPVKNTGPFTQYKGIASGYIYTLLYYDPCHETDRTASCKLKSCYKRCLAHCEYWVDGNRDTTSFTAKGIEGWRVKS